MICMATVAGVEPGYPSLDDIVIMMTLTSDLQLFHVSPTGLAKRLLIKKRSLVFQYRGTSSADEPIYFEVYFVASMT